MTTHQIECLLSNGRKITNGRGHVDMYLPRACSHYEEVPLSDVSEEMHFLVGVASRVLDRDALSQREDTPALREAFRTFVGYGLDAEGRPWVALCHHSRCYPASWDDRAIASLEVMVHGVVTRSGPIEMITVAGPQAYCQKVCYAQTPHFFDVEVWEDHAGREYQIVLRCEYCQHGYNHVTKKGSPSRWRRLMKDKTARQMLKGAVPHRESV